MAVTFWAHPVAASSTLFSGGTIIAFDEDSESLKIIRNGSILVENDRITAIYEDAATNNTSGDTLAVDITGQIITPGFVDTHRHGWQTAFKTLGSNTTLPDYLARFSEFAGASLFSPEDVYVSQLAGIYESLNGGVTTILDHAHHTWSNATAYAGLNASAESGARVFWSYAFHNISSLNYTVSDQIPNFREIAESNILNGTATELGIAYDAWGPNPNVDEVQRIISLAREYNVSVITTHALDGVWGIGNSPEDVHSFGILNDTFPIVFSHASFLTATGAELLRSTNQYISITPESEMHYGQGHEKSHLIQDQASLGVDTHFTYSPDILTQARMWLQSIRYYSYALVLDQWRVPSHNPMSATQAFHLATRAGGLALRRPDIGVIKVGAKADLVVWDARESPSMLGWVDPVAAVMLHANVGDVLHVMVDGKFVKQNGKILSPDYQELRKQFLSSARLIQSKALERPPPVLTGTWPLSTYEYQQPQQADTMRGQGNGYGELYIRT
ncbi:amidohydrolase family protein [Beauveria brongniartii RCEF 3172]|uniref:Amidohydrolase family protein n=1 Tax=Beauveria brongniartii RCEF 3172 TaxID=1081107 RepID=A0A166VTS9_9HYPO|nr:amidohydrolase family protein [Beauveria brongniartii RCEF 3172]